MAVIVILGGISEGASHFDLLRKVTAINPLTGNFRELSELPFATFAPSAGVIGNDIYMFGGMHIFGARDYRYVSHIYKYDNQGWNHLGRYLKEEKGFSQVVELDGVLGILGGHSYFGDGERPLSTFEVFSKKSLN